MSSNTSSSEQGNFMLATGVFFYALVFYCIIAHIILPQYCHSYYTIFENQIRLKFSGIHMSEANY